MSPSGPLPPGATLTYPDDSAQHYTNAWWVTTKEGQPKRGRLVRVIAPHVQQQPYVLVPEGRDEPTEHGSFVGTIKQYQMTAKDSRTPLPVAALTAYENEVWAIYRTKIRPAVVISPGGPEIDKQLIGTKDKWQTHATMLVAPFYGVLPSEKRVGWLPALVERIRRCEYPQYIWDMLPIKSNTPQSILRLDHIQPIGRHVNSYEMTPYCLGEQAMRIFDDWIWWLMEGELPVGGELDKTRKFIAELYPKS